MCRAPILDLWDARGRRVFQHRSRVPEMGDDGMLDLRSTFTQYLRNHREGVDRNDTLTWSGMNIVGIRHSTGGVATAATHGDDSMVRNTREDAANGTGNTPVPLGDNRSGNMTGDAPSRLRPGSENHRVSPNDLSRATDHAINEFRAVLVSMQELRDQLLETFDRNRSRSNRNNEGAAGSGPGARPAENARQQTQAGASVVAAMTPPPTAPEPQDPRLLSYDEFGALYNLRGDSDIREPPENRHHPNIPNRQPIDFETWRNSTRSRAQSPRDSNEFVSPEDHHEPNTSRSRTVEFQQWLDSIRSRGMARPDQRLETRNRIHRSVSIDSGDMREGLFD